MKKCGDKSYFSYGLNIDSYIALPNLVTTQSQSNVNIRPGEVKNSDFYKNFPPDKVISRENLLFVRASKNAFCLEWRGLASCLIQNGSDVILEIEPSVKNKDLVPLITGPVLAVLLHQRKRFVLHASAVNIKNRAVVFVGNKGYGKSTLAAYMQSRGHPLISDDLVPLSFANNSPETMPGYPQIKLFSDSIEAIGLTPSSINTINNSTSKSLISTTGDFSVDPVKIGCIFILEKSDGIEINKLNSVSAFIETLRNTYLSNYLGQTESLSSHFQQCEALINSVPLFQLKRPHNYQYMQFVHEIINDKVSECFI